MHTYDMSANIKFEIADLSCIVYIQFVNISKCLSAVVSSVSSSQLISIPPIGAQKLHHTYIIIRRLKTLKFFQEYVYLVQLICVFFILVLIMNKTR